GLDRSRTQLLVAPLHLLRPRPLDLVVLIEAGDEELSQACALVDGQLEDLGFDLVDAHGSASSRYALKVTPLSLAAPALDELAGALEGRLAHGVAGEQERDLLGALGLLERADPRLRPPLLHHLLHDEVGVPQRGDLGEV